MQQLIRMVAVLLFLPGNALADIVVLKDGTRLAVESYAVERELVIMTMESGQRHSVPLATVDLELTEQLNSGRRGLPTDAPSPAAAVSSAGNGGDPLHDGAPQPTAPARVPPPEGEPSPTSSLAFAPPAPIEPEVMARDSEGRITLRATRVEEAIVLDGKLDDPPYARVKSITGFTQQEPNENQPASEETEVWIFFDEHHVYVGVRSWDSHPERMIANEMRRDNMNILRNANVTLVLDTDYDRRNGFQFQVNALGALRDVLVGDEGQNNNNDWNTVWDAKTSKFDQGWIAEIAIPFNSLRFKSVGPQVWSFNVRRMVIWKNETSFLAPIAAAHGVSGVYRFSDAATLVGVDVPGSNRNLELKPYALSSLTTNQKADEPFSNDPDADFGFDAKYGLTSSLIADFTYNTDFAQVEEDEQQINLTRFNLLFPEKRDFFLEGQSIFAFGGGSTRGGGLTPIMFFSRRIGLTEDGVDPIRVGGRMTGRAGKYRIGALNIQTRGAENDPLIPATNFSVLRLRRDFLRRSDIGVIGTYRDTSLTEGGGSNSLFGVDGNFAFFQALQLNAYYAVSHTPLEEGGTTGSDNASYTGKLDYGGDRYGLIVEHLYVGEQFQPELGFLRREAFRRNYAQGRFSPRPRSIRAIRRFVWQADFDHITDPGGHLETRTIGALFRIEFENGDRAQADYNNNFEFLPEDFEIFDDIILPIGDYRYQDVRVSYTLGQQRTVPSTIAYSTGSFYDGDRQEATFNGRVEISPKFSVEPRLSLNWVDLPEGSFDTQLAGVRVTYTFHPRMFLSSFIQYNSRSDSLSSSVRFRWEYEPGSDLFVVYSEGREDLTLDPFLANRTLAVKFTKLFRF